MATTAQPEILDGYTGEVFVDASFWIALMNVRDEYHNHARETWESVVRRDLRPLTTNWTLYEAMTSLNGRVVARHDRALDLLGLVQRTTIVEDAATLEDAIIAVFISHSDKRWSIADCANFVCIRERRSAIALSYDSDFCQAQAEFAFVRLPLCG